MSHSSTNHACLCLASKRDELGLVQSGMTADVLFAICAQHRHGTRANVGVRCSLLNALTVIRAAVDDGVVYVRITVKRESESGTL